MHVQNPMLQGIEMAGLIGGISEQFIALMKRENEYLRQKDLQKIGDMQMEKARLGFAYESQIKILKENPAIAEGMAPAVKQTLRQIVGELEAVAKENFILLSAAKHVNTKILEAIRDAAIEQKQAQKGYGAIAMPAAVRHRPDKQGVSVSLDERF